MSLPPLIELHGTSIRVGSFLWDPEDKNPLVVGEVAKNIFACESIVSDTSSRKAIQCLRQHLLESSVDQARKASKFLDTAFKLKQWIASIAPEQFETGLSFAKLALEFIENNDFIAISTTSFPTLPWHLIDDPHTVKLMPTSESANSPFSNNMKLARRVQHLIVDEPGFKQFFGTISPVIIQCLEPLYPTLVELTLNNLGLSSVPFELRYLESLTILNVNSNNISNLNGNQLPRSLKHFKCIENSVSAIIADIHCIFVDISFAYRWPEGIHHLHPVEELTIEEIPEDSLHPEFVELNSLKLLLLNNEFPVQVASLKVLSKLDTLWINYCDFEDVFTLTQLKVIYIGQMPTEEANTPSSPMVTLPSSIGNMQHLRGLYFNFWCRLTIPTEIVRCTRLNFLSRQHLRNRLTRIGRKTRFISNWLNGPYPNTGSLPRSAITFNCKTDLFRLPTSPTHSSFTTKQRFQDELLKSRTHVEHYEIELSTDLENHFRTHVYLKVPTRLYNEFFRTYHLAYASDPKEGADFQRATLTTLYQLLMNKSDEFARDASNDGNEFYEAFVDGKIWYNEDISVAGLDIKGAWRPKKENGTFLLPKHKVDRDLQLHIQSFPQKIPEFHDFST